MLKNVLSFFVHKSRYWDSGKIFGGLAYFRFCSQGSEFGHGIFGWSWVGCESISADGLVTDKLQFSHGEFENDTPI